MNALDANASHWTAWQFAGTSGRIGTSARIEIENLMDTKVNLKLWVKVRKEWRDSELYMKNYGYNSKDI